MDWTAEIRDRFAAAGALPDADVLAELSEHATSVYEAALARGEGHDASRLRTERQIQAWAQDAAGHRRHWRTTPVPPPGHAGVFEGIGQDFRYGYRVLTRSPGATAMAIAAITLAIAAVTTTFAVVWSVLVHPLPWPEADRLVRVYESRKGGNSRFTKFVTNVTYHAWREKPQTIEDLAGWRSDELTFEGGAQLERIDAADVTASLANVLRVTPVLGRTLESADEREGAPHVVVLTYGFWQSRFGGRRDVLGRQIKLDGDPATIVGVLPRGVAFPSRTTVLWTALTVPDVASASQGRLSMLYGIARLRSGVSITQASAEATARARAAPDAGPVVLAIFGSKGPVDVTVESALDAATKSVRPALLMLLGAVLLLFVAAVANVAGVQLARALGRRREMALRGALGAGVARLARQLVAENLIVCAAGGALGLALAVALRRTLPTILPADFPRLDDIQVEWRATAVAFGAAVVASLVCGALPALLGRRPDLVAALAEGGQAPAGVRLRLPASRWRAAVIAAQVSVAVVLLVGAVLLGTSFVSLLAADRGFQPAGVLTVSLPMPDSIQPARRQAIVESAFDRLQKVPGVVAVGVTSNPPFSGATAVRVFTMPARDRAGDRFVQTGYQIVSPRYLAALGLRLVDGRWLDDGDTSTSQHVAIVNQSFVRAYLGSAPLGQGLPMGEHGDSWTVVGVIDDPRAADAAPTGPELYVSYRQAGSVGSQPALVIRTAGDPMSYAPLARTLVRELQPDLAIGSIMTLDERLNAILANRRLYAIVLLGLAALSLAIAGVGLFGVLASGVAERTREIAVRAALGATPASLIRLVVRQALLVSAIGLAVGSAAALALARTARAMLYGVGPDDLRVYAVSAGCILCVAALAAIVPARRAATHDPLTLLKGN